MINNFMAILEMKKNQILILITMNCVQKVLFYLKEGN